MGKEGRGEKGGRGGEKKEGVQLGAAPRSGARGANYSDHVTSRNGAADEPMFLLLTDPGGLGTTDAPPPYAGAVPQVDYEGELAIILTGGGQTIPVAGVGAICRAYGATMSRLGH